jgi:protein-L-isoaspartate O-methyltransferase
MTVHTGDSSDVRRARRRLVRELDRSGVGAACRGAFERVPRHLFVPRFWVPGAEQGWELLDGSRPEQHQRWLDLVYRDEALFIRRDEADPLRRSSSSMPSVMAEMLVAADLQPGHRVLEIGTGSGYNAALLCELAGHDVTTMDCDVELVDAARSRLGAAGYTPTVVAGDGFDGYASGAPYDRIIASCAVRQVPRSWIVQTRPGGLVLAMLPHGMAQLRVDDDGSAHGRFHPFPFAFMRMQGHWRRRPPAAELRALVRQDGETAAFGDPPITEETDGRSPYFLLEQLVLFGFDEDVDLDDEQHGLVDLWDLSWVRFDYGASTVTQGGPRRLWEQELALYARWRAQGRPGRERLGLSVPADGGPQEVWIDHPRADDRWPLAGWEPETGDRTVRR